MRATILVVLACALVIVLATGPALSGIEPSPFRLGAVTNILVSIDDRVAKVLSCPPDDINIACPNLNGAVNRLEAMTGQVELQTSMVDAIMAEVLIGADPTPVYPALIEVAGAAANISGTVNAYLASPPDDTVPPEFIAALEGLDTAAQTMAQETIAYIDPGVECSEITNGNLCDSVEGCEWVFGDTGPTGEDIYVCVDAGTAP